MGIYRFKSGIFGLFLRIASCFFIMLSASLDLAGQTGITVLDEQLNPLPGATISQKGTDGGTTTDSLGRANLNLAEAAFFEISFIGFESQKVYIRPDQWLRVVLAVAPTSLGAVKVEGFLDNRELLQQAGGIARLSLPALQRFGENSLVQAINTVPGIRFEERAGASYRISIRGSSIRSPFGVRNVKVYWNGIPFTEPGGNTFINLLDLTNVGSVEIIKGPAASITSS